MALTSTYSAEKSIKLVFWEEFASLSLLDVSREWRHKFTTACVSVSSRLLATFCLKVVLWSFCGVAVLRCGDGVLVLWCCGDLVGKTMIGSRKIDPPSPAFLQEPHEEELHVEPPVAEQATSVVELASELGSTIQQVKRDTLLSGNEDDVQKHANRKAKERMVTIEYAKTTLTQHTIKKNKNSKTRVKTRTTIIITQRNTYFKHTVTTKAKTRCSDELYTLRPIEFR